MNTQPVSMAMEANYQINSLTTIFEGELPSHTPSPQIQPYPTRQIPLQAILLVQLHPYWHGSP